MKRYKLSDTQKTQIKNQLIDLFSNFKTKSQFKLVVLFGSFLVPKKAIKDIDIAIFPVHNKSTKIDSLSLIKDIEDVTEPLKVDLTIANKHTSSLLKYEILRTGVPLLEVDSNETFYQEFSKAFRIYADEEKFRKIKSAELIEKINSL